MSSIQLSLLRFMRPKRTSESTMPPAEDEEASPGASNSASNSMDDETSDCAHSQVMVAEDPLSEGNDLTGESSIESDAGPSESSVSDCTDFCTSDCCSTTQDKPNQPTSKSILAATKRIQGHGKNQQGRYVQASWGKDHNWLTLCTNKQMLFCFYCSAAFRRGLLVFSKNADPAFFKNGFYNWRKASECFRKHEASQAHCEAVLKVTSKTGRRIATRQCMQERATSPKRCSFKTVVIT